MPKIYRYDANGYDNLGTPEWRAIKNIYRFNNSITNKWQALKSIWRYDANGYDNDGTPEWRRIFTGSIPPEITTAPTLKNQLSSYDNFYGGDVLTLTRGAYTNTTANADTTYRMTIYRNISPGTGVGLNNWDPVSRTTFNGSNSTASTSITHTITDQDAKDGYYFAAEVTVNPDANIAGSKPYDFETVIPPGGIQRILSRISFETNSFTVDKKSTWATFAWNATGIVNETFMYQDAASSASVVRISRADNAAFVYDAAANISSLTGSATVPVGTLTSGIGYRADLIIRGNDGWKTDSNFTKNNKGAQTLGSTFVTFTTPGPEPTNTALPTVTPLNNRPGIPVGVLLTVSKGTWINVNASTVYEYQWGYSLGDGQPVYDAWTTTATKTITSSWATWDVWVTVKATNTDGGVGTAKSQNYRADITPAISFGSSTSVDVSTSTNFSFTVSGYPTAYSIDWTNDGTVDFNQPTIAANTPSVSTSVSNTYTTTGTRTLRIVAQPGNIVLDTIITVTPQSFTYTATNPSSISARSAPTQLRKTGTNSVMLDIGNTIANVSQDDIFTYGTGSFSFQNNTATVTQATASGGITYYTTSLTHNFVIDAPVTVTGVPGFNITESPIVSVASNVFAVNSGLNTGSVINQSGTAKAAGIQTITTLFNQYDANANYNLPTGPYETLTLIHSSASNSPISTFVKSTGTTRSIWANVSNTTGALSWRINVSWENASASSVTYFNNGSGTLSALSTGSISLNSSSMPVKILDITGSLNPNVIIDSLTAYGAASQAGTTKAGTIGSPVVFFAVPRPTAKSSVSSANYTYISPPSPFTYSLSNTSSVTAPSAPSHQRSSTFSDNRVVVEFTPALPGSSFPSDTDAYELYIYGAGSSTGGTLANPATQVISSLNLYNTFGNIGTGTFDTISGIALAANNSPISMYTVARGNKRSVTVNASTTTNAQSWAINFSWSNVTSGQTNVIYYSNGSPAGSSSSSTGNITVFSNSLPVKIVDITGTLNPTVTVNSVTAYSGTNQTGEQTSGSSGSPTSINSIAKPLSNATSTTTVNYTANNPTPPTGGSVSISGATTVGSVLTASFVDATGNPAPSKTWLWRIANGGLGGNSFVGGTVMQTGGTTFTIPSTVSTISTVGYSMRAEAIWSNGVSPDQAFNSNSITVTSPPLPTNPTTFTASTNRTTDVQLTWSGATNAVSYEIYWNILSAVRPASTVTPDFPASGQPAITSSPFEDTTIAAGSSRQYWIRVRNAQGATEWFPTGTGSSGRVGTRLLSNPFFPPYFPFFPPYFPFFGGAAPTTPTSVTVSGSGLVSWTASDGSPTSYEIEFYTAQSSTGFSAAGPYTVTGIGGTSHQLTSPYASPNNWARVRVRARNASGASPYSVWYPSETTYT
jgi:hypothetical protein